MISFAPMIFGVNFFNCLNRPKHFCRKKNFQPSNSFFSESRLNFFYQEPSRSRFLPLLLINSSQGLKFFELNRLQPRLTLKKT